MKMEGTASTNAAIMVATSAVPCSASFLVARRSEEVSRGLLGRKVVERWQPLILTRIADGVSTRHFILTPISAAPAASNALTTASTAPSSVHEVVTTNGDRTTANGPDFGTSWVCLSARAQQDHLGTQSPIVASAAAATSIPASAASSSAEVFASGPAPATQLHSDFSWLPPREAKWRSTSVHIEWCSTTAWASSVRYGTALATPALATVLYCDPADLTDLLAFLRGAAVEARRANQGATQASPPPPPPPLPLPFPASLPEQPPNSLHDSRKSINSHNHSSSSGSNTADICGGTVRSSSTLNSSIGSNRSNNSSSNSSSSKSSKSSDIANTYGAVDLFQPALEVLTIAKRLEAASEWASAATAYAQGAGMLEKLAATTTTSTSHTSVNNSSSSSSPSSPKSSSSIEIENSAENVLDAKGRDIAAAQAAHFRVKASNMQTMATPAPPAPASTTSTATLTVDIESTNNSDPTISSEVGGNEDATSSSAAEVALLLPATATPAPAPVPTTTEASDAAVAALQARLKALKAAEEESTGREDAKTIISGPASATNATTGNPVAASSEAFLRLRLSALQECDNHNPNAPMPTEEELAERMAALRGPNARAAATLAAMANLNERYQNLTGQSWAGFGGTSSNQHLRSSSGSSNNGRGRSDINDDVDEETAALQIVAAAEEFEALQRRDRHESSSSSSNSLRYDDNLHGNRNSIRNGQIGNRFNEYDNSNNDDDGEFGMDSFEDAALMATAFQSDGGNGWSHGDFMNSSCSAGGSGVATGNDMIPKESTLGQLGQREQAKGVAALLAEAQAALATVAGNTASGSSASTGSGGGGTGVAPSSELESGRLAEEEGSDKGDKDEDEAGATAAEEAAAVDRIVRAAQEQAAAEAAAAKAAAELNAEAAANEAAAADALGTPLPPVAPQRAPVPQSPPRDEASHSRGGHAAAADSGFGTNGGSASRARAKGQRKARGSSRRGNDSDDGGTSSSEPLSPTESESEESDDGA